MRKTLVNGTKTGCTWALLSQVTLRFNPKTLSRLRSHCNFDSTTLSGLHQSLVQRLSEKDWTTTTPIAGSVATTKSNAGFQRDLKFWKNQKGVDMVACCHREFKQTSINNDAIKGLRTAANHMVARWWASNRYHVNSIDKPQVFLSIQTREESKTCFSAYHWGISFHTKLGYEDALKNNDMAYLLNEWLPEKCRYIHSYQTITSDRVFVDTYFIYHRSVEMQSMKDAIRDNCNSIVAICKQEIMEFWEDVDFINNRRRTTTASTILDATLIDIFDAQEVESICAREAQQRNLNSTVLHTPVSEKHGASRSNNSEGSFTSPAPGTNDSFLYTLY